MRISTQAASQAALLDLMSAQRESFQAREQLATGKKAPDLKGYATSAETIMTARATQSRAESYIQSNERLGARLAVQDLAYRDLSDAASELRQALTTTEGTSLMNQVQAAFDKVVNALSTKFSGSYVFSGVRTDSAPLNATTLDQLQAAAPDVSAVFENAERRQSAHIDSETQITVNQTASEVAGGLMSAFERIADFHDGPDGPFNGPMNDAQRAFVQAEVGNIVDAFDTINAAMAENGSKQARVEASIESHRGRSDYLASMISDLEDVDMAEAWTRLSQAQNAVQVSASTFSTLSQVSLLPFLR